MKPKKLSLLLTILPMIIAATGCHSRQESKADITPHCINLQADSLYQQAIALMESSYDVDSTRKCIRYENKDSLFMRNIDEIRKRFPERLLEIEMTRRVKPHSLVNQIRRIQIEKDYNIDFDMDSLVEATVAK